MDRVIGIKHKGGQVYSQARGTSFRGMWRPCRVLTLAISFLAFVLGGMVSVEKASSHPGSDHEIEEISQALVLEPDRIDLRIERGRLYRLNGNFNEALNDFDYAKQLSPENKEVALGRAYTLSALGRDVEAEMELDRVLDQELDRSMVPALAERGNIRARTGRPELAIEDFTMAANLQPSVELFLARGQVHENLENFKAAASDYREGLLRVGDNVLLKKAHIRVAMIQKHYAEALQLVDEELSKASVKTPWYLQRAEILTRMGRANEAQQTREQALAETNLALGKRPTAIHRVSRAKVYMAMGRLEEAKRDLQLAVQIAPHYAEAGELLASLEGR